jgi:excisionase family DNA binding protein
VSAPLLDAKQAAELLAIPPTWLLAEARRDRVPHVRFGRYVRFDPEELERWWRARMRGPTVAGSNPSGPAARTRPGP